MAEADEVLRRAPGRIEARAVRIMARLQLDAASARGEAEALVAAAPRDARAWLALAAVRLRDGDVQATEEAATRSLLLDPECERRQARSHRAEARLRAGRAREAYDDALALFMAQPDELGAWLLRARASEALGRLEAAEADLDHALRMVGDEHPMAAAIRSALARLRARLGR